jgi:hypothetical protein
LLTELRPLAPSPWMTAPGYRWACNHFYPQFWFIVCHHTRTPFTATVLVTGLKYECLLVVNWMTPSLASHPAYYIVNTRLASVCLTELKHNVHILSESCGVGRLAESLHAF